MYIIYFIINKNLSNKIINKLLNFSMTKVDELITKLLNENLTDYTVYGAGYKNECKVPIIEESQKLLIGSELAKKGLKVTIRDNKLLLDCVKLEYGNLFNYEETSE